MQNLVFAESNELIAELRDSDIIVICVAVYNFSVPAALKAWIDQVMPFCACFVDASMRDFIQSIPQTQCHA